MIIEREKAPDSIALDQPNSVRTGLRKTPYDKYEQNIIVIIRNEAMTMV